MKIPQEQFQLLSDLYKTIDPAFGHDCQRIELDLGCGKGSFALALAADKPQTLVLAADIKIRRLRKMLRKAVRFEINNLEALRCEATELMGYQLPSASIDRIHILCPDPWPKSRHRCHRLITSEFLGRTAAILKPGGVLHLATDHPGYFETMQLAIEGLKFYKAEPEAIDDISHIKTDFEKAYLEEGKTVPHLAYRKICEVNK